MTDLPFKADDTEQPSETNLIASLNLSGKPAGNFYFNKENNFTYTKNWYNYGSFYGLNGSIIKEVVQYGKPDIVPGTLDNTKTYDISSTSMNAYWAARIETGTNILNPGYSGTDLFGNSYAIANYTDLNNAVVYSSNNAIAFTKLNNGLGSSSICVAKFNPSGAGLWASRITTQVVGQTTSAVYCAVDNQGTIYILGEGQGVVFFENSTGAVVYSIDVTDKTYLVAYNTTGAPNWITYFTKGYKGFLCVDNQDVGNVYIVNFSKYYNKPTIFYDNITVAPIPVLASGKNIASGTLEIVSVERSIGGVATITLNQSAVNLGLETGMYVALLGITNDGSTFNTTNPVQITVSGSTFTYTNAVGSMPYVSTLTAGYPVLTVTTDSSAYIIGKFRSSSGLFQWSTCIDGYRVFNWRNFLDYSNQSLTTDPDGNLIVTGYYTEITSVKNAATPTQPLLVDSGITKLPPYSSPIVWVPYEFNRNWSGVDINSTGNIIVATVNGGYIYTTLDGGDSWNQRATIQAWSSVYCNSTGSVMVATIEGSIIYRTADSGVLWFSTQGEGANAKDWIAIAGNASASKMVAASQNDSLYYSTNTGIFWSVSNAPNANWVDVSYDETAGAFIALIKGGQAYRSTDGGATWNLLGASPSLNWSAISGSRDTGSVGYAFFATVENGVVYGVNGAGTVWTIVDDTVRNYTDVCNSGGSQELMYSSVYNGALYQTTYGFENIWIPTSIPRFWNRMAISYGNGGVLSTVVATVEGGQIYIATNSYPTRHTFVVKYNPDGIAQWNNYVNTQEIFEENNQGISIDTLSNGDIILFGNAASTSPTYFYAPDNFDMPIKTLPVATSYLACYSNAGLPLWTDLIAMASPSTMTSISTDSQDNIYCFGYAGNISLYNPIGQLMYTNANNQSGVLLKYYPNGYLQSFTRITNATTPAVVYGTSVYTTGLIGDVYLSGWNDAASTLNFYNSPGTVIGLTEPFSTRGVFITKYTSTYTPSITFPPVGYNSVFDTRFTVGGSTRELINGYVYDGPIEIWGGETGLSPSSITIQDANASVISYLGHEPGFTIPTNNGLQISSPMAYNFLTLYMSEPSFPTCDPQPLTPGTIPYGYLPIFISVPSYATGLVFNNTLNDETNLILYTTGTISADNLYLSGITAGDTIRILVHDTVVEYVTLTVYGFILSNVINNIQAGIVFQESTRCMTNILNGTTSNATVTLITTSSGIYCPSFYPPPLIQSGHLNVTLQICPKY